jgi:hypothetical protein
MARSPYDDDVFDWTVAPATPSLWESASVRWIAQILVGALPGLVLVMALLHAAQTLDPKSPKGSAASVVPLFSAGAVGANASFQRLGQPQEYAARVRAIVPTSPDLEPRRVLPVVKRVRPLPVDFQAPRTQWQHLGAAERLALDQGLAKPGQWERVVLHGSGRSMGTSGMMQRYHERVRGIQTGLAHHFVIGNGTGTGDGEVTVSERWQAGLTAADLADAELRAGSISVCLMGDFQTRGPTPAQLAALDELLDYLRVKLGALRVTTHSHLDQSNCLGAKFPVDEVLAATNQ